MKSIIKRKDQKLLLQHLEKMHPYDIAEEVKGLSEEEKDLFYSLLSEEEIARIIAFMEPEEGCRIKISEKMKALELLGKCLDLFETPEPADSDLNVEIKVIE